MSLCELHSYLPPAANDGCDVVNFLLTTKAAPREFLATYDKQKKLDLYEKHDKHKVKKNCVNSDYFSYSAT